MYAKELTCCLILLYKQNLNWNICPQNLKVMRQLVISVLLLLSIINKSIIDCKPFDCDETNSFCSRHLISRTKLCDFCSLTLPIARNLIANNRTKYFHDIATLICEDFKIAEKTVCSMAVDLYEVCKKKKIYQSDGN